MEYQGIYHRPRSEFAYFQEGKEVHLLLRAVKDDLVSVVLCWFDKYMPEESLTHTEMELDLSDHRFSYYRLNIVPKFRRLQYYFRLEDKDGTVAFFDEQGFHQEFAQCEQNCFQVPYLNLGDSLSVPKWATTSIFYQIFPDSFARTLPEGEGGDLPAWGSEPDILAHLGGNFQGLVDHFQHLLDLGVTALYFCPIFQSNSCHRYNTYDYFKIDPRLGTLDEFKSLLELCHKHGIYVVLDAVFNHTCDTFPYFMDVLEQGENSQYTDWYFIHNYPVTVDENYQYERFAFERHMPKLNTEHPPTVEYLLEVARYWTEMGIDGWRLDVANEVDLDFWRKFRRIVKGINPEALILGEIWGDAQPYLNGDMFDSVMNYPFALASQAYFLENTLSVEDFQQAINRWLVCYPQPVTYALYNLFGSHDTPRWMDLGKKKPDPVILSVVFQFFFVGMPAIYYGDETGMEGKDFVEARRCMDFTPKKTGQRFLAIYKALITFRKAHPVLTQGNFSWLDLEGASPEASVLGFSRCLDGHSCTLVLNRSDIPATVAVPLPDGSKPSCTLAPMSYQIFEDNQEVTL